MEKMKKVVEVCEPAALTNMAALNHLLGQVEWWHWVIVACIVLVALVLVAKSAQNHGYALGKFEGAGKPSHLRIDGRYKAIPVPENTHLMLLQEIGTDTAALYSIDANAVVGGAQQLASAKVFQAVSAHGGDMLQLCELEIVPEKEAAPKLRQRVVHRLLWWRSKKSVAVEAQPA